MPEVMFKSYNKYLKFMIKNFKECRKVKQEAPYEGDFEFFKLMIDEDAVFHCNIKQLFAQEGAKVTLTYDEINDENERVEFDRVTKIEIRCDLISSAEDAYTREDPNAEGTYELSGWKKLSKSVAKEGETEQVFKITGLNKKSGGIEPDDEESD